MPFSSTKKTLHCALLASSLVVLGVLSGCASELSGHRYSRHEARQAQRVQFGTLVSIETVELEGSESGAGGLAGATAGGIAGSAFGKGGGKGLSVIAGAVAGYALGNQAEKTATETTASNLTIELETGGHIAIVQQLEAPDSLLVGDRVKVLSIGNTSRVVRAPH